MRTKLLHVQSKLKCNKSQYNSFGKYSYRSAEDILEAVKPLLAEEGLLLTLTDTVELIGDRYYIKATAAISDPESKEELAVNAYAREDQDKKGMDGSQISGTASSYARKYALNGLFLIDDTKDADTDEHYKQSGRAPKQAAKPQADDEPTKDEKLYFVEMCKNRSLNYKDILAQAGCTGRVDNDILLRAIKIAEAYPLRKTKEEK